jgi:hypothetical protein
MKLLIENTRLKFNEAILGESEVLPGHYVPRLQRMMNEASLVLNRELNEKFLQEGMQFYADLASAYVTEVLEENVRAKFKELQNLQEQEAGKPSTFDNTLFYGTLGAGLGAAGYLAYDDHVNTQEAIAREDQHAAQFTADRAMIDGVKKEFGSAEVAKNLDTPDKINSHIAKVYNTDPENLKDVMTKTHGEEGARNIMKDYHTTAENTNKNFNSQIVAEKGTDFVNNTRQNGDGTISELRADGSVIRTINPISGTELNKHNTGINDIANTATTFFGKK